MLHSVLTQFVRGARRITHSFVDGFRIIPGALSAENQRELLESVRARIARAPLYRPVTPGGHAMSVRMTNFGPLGWLTDRSGYRYAPRHPQTGEPWPDMPPILIELWRRHTGEAPAADACLVNWYDETARMGLHVDSDEADFSVPVLSVSLGDTAVFRIGGLKRSDPTASVRLLSGDICLLGGPARLAYHGVDRIIAGSSRLIEGGGRINLTLRRSSP
jgi:alkylated DNA repair protein (DNA oxidative demethylase)